MVLKEMSYCPWKRLVENGEWWMIYKRDLFAAAPSLALRYVTKIRIPYSIHTASEYVGRWTKRAREGKCTSTYSKYMYRIYEEHTYTLCPARQEGGIKPMKRKSQMMAKFLCVCVWVWGKTQEWLRVNGKSKAEDLKPHTIKLSSFIFEFSWVAFRIREWHINSSSFSSSFSDITEN